MGIYLAGSTPDPGSFPAVFDHFVRALPHHRPARIALVLHAAGRDPAGALPAYVDPLEARIACEVVPVLLRQDGTAGAVRPASPTSFHNVDAVMVGGGQTPAYLAGLSGSGAEISRLVAGGASYLGFSAGAMVAPGAALIGGYRIDGVEVCDAGCSEGLDNVEVRAGLGLAPFTVDVHAAQAGTVSRAAGAVAAGLVDRMVAIDEGTALVLATTENADYEVLGTGRCWDFRREDVAGGLPAPGAAAVVSLRVAGHGT
ncbi:hypothetical protein ACU18_08325 [Arthrobacter sp. ZBG10]|uniref:Type 1 glutamine amidotransferase-like domain-containing protein n=1 Tax=Arthrobacter sp. ZBG10 TaxID=1676590 RepID=UPI0006824A56|nr:Type 1 glutamine amidotransferase-like domain-containing protein [Arthrobacter sp. ZBG10]KNH18001.1 hypothetical protein ACU18_08325 [Arthrobacter sp. ZBG10]